MIPSSIALQFLVRSQPASNSFKTFLAEHGCVQHSMDGLSVDTNETWMRYRLVLAGHRRIKSRLTVLEWVICVLSMGFKWALADYRWVKVGASTA